MGHKNNVKKVMLIVPVLLVALLNQPMKVYAYADLHKEKGHDVEKSRDQGDDHKRDGDKRDEHKDEHQDQHQDEHHGE